MARSCYETFYGTLRVSAKLPRDGKIILISARPADEASRIPNLSIVKIRHLKDVIAMGFDGGFVGSGGRLTTTARVADPRALQYKIASSGRLVGNPYLGITSRLPLIRP